LRGGRPRPREQWPERDPANHIGGSTATDIAIVESVEIGPVRLENIPSNVNTLSVSLGMSDNKGLLGMDVLRHCVIDYDQQNSVIRLYDPNTYSPPDEEWKPLLDHNASRSWRCVSKDTTGSSTIDTGNPGAVIFSPHTVERLSLLDGRKTRSGLLHAL